MTVFLCTCLLTGCSGEEADDTGTYLLRIGRNIFQKSFSGWFKDSDLGEPQSNEVAEILYDYNVKGVESAPKSEKSEYDYTGPENAGIPVMPEEIGTPDDNAIITGGGETGSGTEVGTGAVIVLSSGHINGGNSDLELYRMSGYGVAAVDLVMQFRSNRDIGMKSFCIPKLQNKNKELAQNICGKTSGKVTRNELIKRLIELKIIKTAGRDNGGNYGTDQKFQYTFQKGKKINYESFYKSGGSLFEKNILDFLNQNDGSALRSWADNCKWVYGGKTNKWNSGSLYLFKDMATTGGASNKGGIDEYSLNFSTTKRLKSLLEKDGYSVILTRSKKEDTKLDNGVDFSNRNMALFAAEQKGAVLHLMVHWDSDIEGIHCLTGKEDIVGGKAVTVAEEVANVIEKKSGKVAVYESATSTSTKEVKREKLVTTVDSLHSTINYTGLNWQGIPTIELECGCMTAGGDIEKYIEGGKFYADKFWEGRYDIVKEGIEKAVKESGLSVSGITSSANFKAVNQGNDLQATSKTTYKDLNHEQGHKNVKERFERFLSLFQECAKVYGVPVSVSIAQFIEETQAGIAGGPAQKGNNGFGQKKGGKHLPGSTWDGISIYTTGDGEVYRAYDSLESSIIDHSVLLARGDSYAAARKTKTMNDYLEAMASVYCEGDGYANRLKVHIKDYDLTKYDIKN